MKCGVENFVLISVYFCFCVVIKLFCFLSQYAWMWPGRKLGNLRNLANIRNFFPRFLNLSFQFWQQGKIENLEIKKLRITFPRFQRFPTFLSFWFATFSFSFFFFPIFRNVFSNSLIYISNYISTLLFLFYFLFLHFYFIHTVQLSY